MRKIFNNILILLLLLPLVGLAQNTKEENLFSFRAQDASVDANNVDKIGGERFGIGILLGTDIGGSIPMPMKYIPSTFNPYPELNISIGARFSYALARRWSIHAEATYKQVVMRADARVDDQKFQMNGQMQVFSGSAEMVMDFTMMEFPLYAKWSINKRYNSFFLFGAYYAHYLSPKFVTTAYNGYVGGVPDEVAGAVTPDDPTVMDFSEYLGTSDYGIVLGYERRIWNRANLGLRFSMGFKDIFRADSAFFDYAMWQMRGTVVLEYDLFQMVKKR